MRSRPTWRDENGNLLYEPRKRWSYFAIILAAAKDHRRALRRLKKYPWDKDAESVRKDCERFFRSSWFQTLTSLDGEVLIEKLHREGYGV